jgi:archaellum biogenesis ATPase FlaH
MSKETLTLNKPRIPAKEYGNQQRAINYQIIEELAKKCLQDIGVSLDFDESIQGATRERLAHVMHNLVVIRHKNKMNKEHKP